MPFVELVLEDSRDTEKLARLSYAILASGSARKSDWARFYRPGASEEANYKAIERLMERLDPEAFLHRLLDAQSPFVLVDLTEVRRPQAKRTPYVGRLRDGGLGFWVFTLAQPYGGRAVPIHLGLYSQATLEAEGTGRNLVWRAFLQEALRYVEPGTVLVFDREFSFAGWLGVMAVHLGKGPQRRGRCAVRHPVERQGQGVPGGRGGQAGGVAASPGGGGEAFWGVLPDRGVFGGVPGERGGGLGPWAEGTPLGDGEPTLRGTSWGVPGADED